MCVPGDERAKRFASYETLFGLQPSDFSRVDQANKELQWHSNKWTYLHDFIKLTESWYDGEFASPTEHFQSSRHRGCACLAIAAPQSF